MVKYKRAAFSGGCFWCTEYDFDQREGIIEVVSGFVNGKEKDPSYEQVASGQTGHREGVLITYDPNKIRYETLLELFWKSIDPADDGGQFVDRGFQYTTAIYYEEDEQKKLAEKSKKELEKSGKFGKIATKILKLISFYPAEEYHQKYYKKSPLRYKMYRNGSGRDRYLDSVWGKDRKAQTVSKQFVKPSDEELRKKLTPKQYSVTQEEDTERAFDNEYWDNKEEGLYVDVVSGEPLFSSKDKYDSGCGWPSFTKPLTEDKVTTKKDYKLLFPRTEIRSKNADSHLGHVFNDGPKEKGGKRYCMNSAAMRFIPKNRLEKEGYGEWVKEFEKNQNT